MMSKGTDRSCPIVAYRATAVKGTWLRFILTTFEGRKIMNLAWADQPRFTGAKPHAGFTLSLHGRGSVASSKKILLRAWTSIREPCRAGSTAFCQPRLISQGLLPFYTVTLMSCSDRLAIIGQEDSSRAVQNRKLTISKKQWKPRFPRKAARAAKPSPPSTLPKVTLPAKST